MSNYNLFTIVYTHARNGTLLLTIIVTWDNTIHVIVIVGTRNTAH